MSTYKQPIGQKRLTNIALVRVKKYGLRFEVACYKNKVMSWRAGIEKDIDEVLQTHTIFANVGKGTLAKHTDLMKAFGTDDEDVICRKILEEGEYQVSDKEREMVAGSQMRDVLFMVMERTVNPDTLRPYSIGMVEKFAQQVHFAVDPTKSSKQQALDLIRQLAQDFPIVRAQMELRLTAPASLLGPTAPGFQDQLAAWGAVLVSHSEEGSFGTGSVVLRVDPGLYRQCDAWAQGNAGRLEVLNTAVQADGDVSFDRLDTGMQALRVDDVLKGPQDVSGARAPEEQQHVAGQQDEQRTANGAQETPLASAPNTAKEPVKGMRCTTCSCMVDTRESYREHCKTKWHKHNMRRKTRQLPPLSEEECELDMDLVGEHDDKNEFK